MGEQSLTDNLLENLSQSRRTESSASDPPPTASKAEIADEDKVEIRRRDLMRSDGSGHRAGSESEDEPPMFGRPMPTETLQQLNQGVVNTPLQRPTHKMPKQDSVGGGVDQEVAVFGKPLPEGTPTASSVEEDRLEEGEISSDYEKCSSKKSKPKKKIKIKKEL